MGESKVGQTLDIEVMRDDYWILVVIDPNDQCLFALSPCEICPNKVDILKRIGIDVDSVQCCWVAHLETILVELDYDIFSDNIRDIL